MNRRALLLTAFTAGMTSLGIELAAARLLGNVFGTSNLVWANIIGLILVYLTAGYFLGGRWADRSPHATTFYRLVVWAAFTAGLIPIVAQPVLRWAAGAVEELNAAIMAGSFLAVLILFCVPVTLLGCVSPFVIRLLIEDPTAGRAGLGAGVCHLDAGFDPGDVPAGPVADPGDRHGAHLPGSQRKPAPGGAAWDDHGRSPSGPAHGWMPIVLLGLAAWALSGPIKASTGQIFETESAYNYIQVREVGGVRYLLLNEGQAVHSVYDPDGGPRPTGPGTTSWRRRSSIRRPTRRIAWSGWGSSGWPPGRLPSSTRRSSVPSRSTAGISIRRSWRSAESTST